ncbi:DHH family phosphoesterase [Vibrio rarus]|uniref:DHH family phosphoesterase n=1 Tax=Vibrio rarus TaxID=413403 RepID=UPI0021C2B02A|nr:DHH family phosphoesterase [Vibrio rarus]
MSNTHFDVFNGDADGICALLQLRLTTPQPSTLITGVKRDIELLQQVTQQSTAQWVTVLDISMQKNQQPLTALLQSEVHVFYCDHHRTGDIPYSDYLHAHIDTAAETCTSLLINQHLQGAQYLWACTGAFGDNLIEQGQALAQSYHTANDDIDFLKELGTLINYNSYGYTIDDLHIAPDTLYRILSSYASPLELKDDVTSVFYQLQNGFSQDWQQAEQSKAYFSNAHLDVYLLADAPWARRISGTLGNWLANQNPSKAIAVLTPNPNQSSYTVSVRSPLQRREGADEVCSQFPSGGGRKGAAGINALPKQQLSLFIQTMTEQFSH